VRLLPSLTDFAFLLPLFILFGILHGATTLLADGDTGWHIRTGEWIIQNHAIPTVDLFSFTKPHQSWFAWEWGWDVIAALIHSAAGLAGIAMVNALLLGLISVLLFRLIRRYTGNDLLSFLFTGISVCGTSIHWLARPHLISWLFLLIFAHVILSAGAGKLRPLWWLPALTLVWTNLHGGFFVGILLLLTSAAGEAVGGIGGVRRSRPYLLCACACLAVTLLNPYTWHLHQHVYRYLLDPTLLDNIQEFQSPSFHHGGAIFFEVMLLAGAGAVVWCLERRQWTGALSILIWAHFALVSSRNIPLFLLISTPWTAGMTNDLVSRWRQVSWLRSVGATISEICAEFSPLERIERWHAVSLAALLFLGASFAAGRPGFQAQFDPHTFPVAAIPVIKRAKPSHIFTYDQWGDYLIYRLYPSQPVFLDGRSDFYGPRLVNDYQHIISARYDWELDLKRFAVDMVIIRPNAPLATILKLSPNWKMLLDNGSLIIFRAEAPRGTREPVAAKRIPPIEADGSGRSLITQERRS
jgi:hypothetical protein